MTQSNQFIKPSPEKIQSASSVKRPIVIVIAGPTAVGKTALSLKIASRIGAHIISADSMQIYRGADIGTSKVSLEIRQKIPHYMIDIRNIEEPFNVVDFVTHADCALDQIHSLGLPSLVVGGTGFYIRSLLTGPPQGPPSDPEVRADLNLELEKFGPELLFEKLQRYDPIYAATITTMDRHKLIRALEIITISGGRVSDIPKPSIHSRSHLYDFRCWFLSDNKEKLYQRIQERCHSMMDEGFLKEVQHLLSHGILENPSAKNAIGYRQAIDFLTAESQSPDDYDKFFQEFMTKSRHYAKRQFTWFRREPSFRWLDLSTLSLDEAADIILQDRALF